MKLVRLRDLCVGKGEYGIAASAEDFSEEKYRYLRITDISDDGELLSSDCKSISCNGCEKYLLKKDEIVFARTGNSTGRTFFYEEKYGPLVYAGFLIKFHLDDTKVNPKFLKYYTISNTYKTWIANGPTGSTRGNMAESDFADMPIFLPSRDQQDVLVKTLELIDEKLSNNNVICSELEAMTKLLYDYWFVQFDFPDENGNPYKSSGGKLVWNDELKRKIPKGWDVSPIGDMISTERGLSYSTPNIKSGQGVPMLNLATFMPGGGEYKADGLKHYLGDYPKNKTLQPYDLIMCNTQQTAIKFETDIIGRAMLVPDIFEDDIVFSHHVNVIRTQNEVMKYYLLYLFNSDYYHKYISGFTNGTNILGLSFNGVEDYITEIPDQGLLKKFGAIVLDVEKKKSEILIENQQLASLRDFLLPMLMNGQVKVGKVGA